ncbi:flippase-like domain-containing protein [Olivibacter sp. SDN3]|uniref:lysylphosphatidylglycerol synthase transmembrane domain-containing protein n=1 Tax=Olivibacter sp. SDN3 TaxID=2764720 RepID=UPI0016514211|nr:lysylphosphatidylglycerol synthase transmembrane domain-containing protein [Olivibacter sp. SDN3]QNL48289.1 flippase-like domain-containing protein [Olivibacter sp. SDN3]
MASKIYKVLFFVIGMTTLCYMVYALGVDVIWENIKKTGWWFLPVIGSWLIIYILNAIAFKAIIQEPTIPASNLPFLSVLKLTITGYVINYITPFVALGGEPYRIMELKPRLGVQKASSSVLLYSLMHMFSHVIFWLASIILILLYVPANTIMITGCSVMFITGVVLCYWFGRIYKKGFTLSIFKALAKIPGLKKKVGSFVAERQDSLREIDHQITELYAKRRGRFWQSLSFEFIARVVGCIEIYCTARAIDLNMSVVQSLIVSSGSSLFANLIFFFPMQLGTREGGLALALKSVGMPGAAGIFIGIIMRIRELVWIIIGLFLMKLAKPALKTAEQVEKIETNTEI